LNADLTKFEVLCYLRNNSSDESVKVRRASLTEHRSVTSQQFIGQSPFTGLVDTVYANIIQFAVKLEQEMQPSLVMCILLKLVAV